MVSVSGRSSKLSIYFLWLMRSNGMILITVIGSVFLLPPGPMGPSTLCRMGYFSPEICTSYLTPIISRSIQMCFQSRLEVFVVFVANTSLG